MQVLQWAARYPDAVFAALPIAGAAYHSAQNIAFHEVGRQAIFADPDWQGGRYWRAGKIPARGLAVARMCAHITYLSEQALTRKFGRRLQNAPKDPSEAISLFGEMFEVESYLHHQGSTFVRRFDANSYLTITRAMDYFDLAADYEGDLAERVSRHADAVPARFVHLRLAVPDGRKPRDRARAEPRGGECQLRGDPDRQGPRRLPAGRAGFPPHVSGLPCGLCRACRARGVGVPNPPGGGPATDETVLVMADEGRPSTSSLDARGSSS